jgi:hypothetical protein
MSDLHDVSRVIGQLEQAVQDGARSRDLLRGELKDHRESSERNHKRIEEKLDCLLAAMPPLTGRVAAMEPDVESFRRLRQRAKGGAIVITGVGTLIGAVLSWVHGGKP